MFERLKVRSLKRLRFAGFAIGGLMLIWVFAAAGNAQAVASATKKSASAPVLKNYPELKVGTAVGDVREKLGKAKIDDDDGLYYEISDNEIMQIRVDADKKLRAVSITYSSGHKSMPKFADVFGSSDGEAAATKPDGSIYRLVRYPDAGYWLAFSRTAGEDPSVTVTMQKL
ncbi:MAG: hypothetical protein H7070_01125 [Saprospiraceae bacterium]|nr:hypothetical protein [Pyrinomonadaceae bacterium]